MNNEGMIELFKKYLEQCDKVIRMQDKRDAKRLVMEIESALSNIDGIGTGSDRYSLSLAYGERSFPEAGQDYLDELYKLKGKIEAEMAKAIDNRSSHIEGGLVPGDSDSTRKSCKIFISHASKDKEYVAKLVELLEGIGVGEKGMFCSSVDGYGIPMDENIYDYLQKQFQENNLHVIYVLSDNYYKSAACLNEMGAAWVLRQRYTSILLPKFEYEKINGAVDPRKIALKLDDEGSTLDQRLGDFMEDIVKEFKLDLLSRSKWDRIRNKFKDEIREIANKKTSER